MNSKSKTIANFGIIAALITVAIVIDTAISRAGLPVSIAVATIIVVLVICQTNDLKTAVFASTFFGVLSLIRAFILPTPTSLPFQNPLISIFPRIIIGFTCYFSLKLFQQIFTKYKSNIAKTIPFIISGAIGVLTNTSLVLTMMFLFSSIVFAEFVASIISFNFLIEFLCAVLIVPTISRSLIRATKNIGTNKMSDKRDKKNKENPNKKQDEL